MYDRERCVQERGAPSAPICEAGNCYFMEVECLWFFYAMVGYMAIIIMADGNGVHTRKININDIYWILI